MLVAVKNRKSSVGWLSRKHLKDVGYVDECVFYCVENEFSHVSQVELQVCPTVLSASLPYHSQATRPALCQSLDLLVPGASSLTDSGGRWMRITRAVCESAGGGEKKAGVILSSLQPLLSCWVIISQARSRPQGLVTIPTHCRISFPPCCPPFSLKCCGKLSWGSAFVYLHPPDKHRFFRVAL